MLGEMGDAWMLRLHMQLARELNGSGWSQNQIARILGSTQSTVSRQLIRPLPKLPSADADTVDGWAFDLAKHLAILGPETKVERQRLIMEIQFTGGQVFQSNKSLTGVELEGGAKMASLLRQLEWSCSRLDVNRVKNWLSAVGMNLAACLPDAHNPEEVAAFPGRLSILDGRIRHLEKATLGASRSLARILLQALAKDSSNCAIINIKAPMKDGGMEVDERRLKNAAEQIGWNVADSQRGNVKATEGAFQLILDSGGFGWEPHVFILGSTPGEVVSRTHSLIDVLEVDGD